MTVLPGLALLVVAGGAGRRFGRGNKLLLPLAGEPVFLHSLRRLGPLAGFRVLVVPPAVREVFQQLLAERLPELSVTLASGGAERGDSVQNGLAVLPEEVRWVAIHDAARPLAGPALLQACYDRAREVGAAIPGHPVIDTLKRVAANGQIVETVSREALYGVETPQVFALEQLREAYRRAGTTRFTDDAAVLEAAGFPVAVVPNLSDNRKLTYPEDLPLLAAKLASC